MVATTEDEKEDLETLTAAKRVIVSWDIDRRRRTECTLVNRFIFGREVTVRLKTGRKRYRYQGLVMRPWVERIAQSALMMREKDAEDLVSFLHRLRVPCTRFEAWIRV